MVIQHIINKNSCMRIQLLVSVKDALLYHYNFYLGYTVFFSLVQLLFIQHFSLVQLLFNKGSFITPASIYVLFSSLQVLFMQYSFHLSSVYLYGILFITPASTC